MVTHGMPTDEGSRSSVLSTTGVMKAIVVLMITLALRHSFAGGLEIRTEVALRDRKPQHGSPDPQACQRVVDFGLGEKALRFGDFHDGPQPHFVSRGGLQFGRAGGIDYDRRVRRYAPGARQRSLRALDLAFDFLLDLFIAGALGALVGLLDLFSRPDGIALEQRECHAHTQ